jgi:YrbI family 3-deoxy-D-manno-octulosonate 8-phosphate phosphatase
VTQTIAIIPARGGSDRVPRKNLVPLAGLPLLAHSIGHALRASSVSETYVSTENSEIAAVAERHGASVVFRPAELSEEAATSESALLHALEVRRSAGLDDPDLVVFLQCTSPVRAEDDIDRAVARLQAAGADSLLSATQSRGLIWGRRHEGPVSLNYDSDARQREQDMPDQWRENGSIYVMSPRVLREHGNRLGGKIEIFPMDYWSSFQLDTSEDVRLLEWILTEVRPAFRQWPARVELVAFDFDGVMTDNTVIVDDRGGESVRANRADGWGLARLRETGLPLVVLSTEEHPVVAARCQKLRIECRQGLEDKGAALRNLIDERGIRAEHVVYVGNDVNDLGCFDVAGFPVAVADAHPRILASAAYILRRRGGEGAVRELCDLLLARLS